MLEGELTFLTVMKLYSESQKQFSLDVLSIKIDFQRIKRVDSSVLSLLIEWKRLAKKRGSSVQFIHVPEAILRLASLSQVEQMLFDS